MSNSTDIPVLQAERRERLGSRYSERLRNAGKLPSVLYGHQAEPAHIALDNEAFLECLHNNAHLVNIAIDGDANASCLLKDLQYDYLGTTIIHADFTRVDLNEKVNVSVPVQIVGKDESPGAKEANTIISQPILDLDITCTAINIPDHVTADISNLNVGETLTVADIELPEGVETDHASTAAVITIALSKAGKSAATDDEEGEGDEAAEGDEATASE